MLTPAMIAFGSEVLCHDFEFRRKQSVDELIEALPVHGNGDFEKCVPFEQLTVEVAVYWRSLIEYLQTNGDSKRRSLDDGDDDYGDTEAVDRVHEVIGELSTFCEYLTK